jgi:hypothetical protein
VARRGRTRTRSTREPHNAVANKAYSIERELHVIPTMDIEWMVIKESLGVEEATRRRRAQVEEMLGMTSKPEAPEPVRNGRSFAIGSWLARAWSTVVGCRPGWSTTQVACQG